MLLTGDGSRLMEDSSYLRIHGNHVIALESNPLVSTVDLCIDPVLEILTHDGIDNIGQVGTTELLDLFAWRQSTLYISIVLGKIEYVLDS